MTHEARHAAWADRVVFLRDGSWSTSPAPTGPTPARVDAVNRPLSGWLGGWRLALRLARRDALRSRGRSILVLVMIALPVLGVTAADVLLRTQDVNTRESLDRRLGAADARVTVQKGIGTLYQWVDPDQASASGGDENAKPLTRQQVGAALGGLGQRLVEERTGNVTVATDKGEERRRGGGDRPPGPGHGRALPGSTPATGRPGQGEVVINAALAAKGHAVGEPLDVVGRPTRLDPVVVGIAESATNRSFPMVAGPVGTWDVETFGARTWLVPSGPVTWARSGR